MVEWKALNRNSVDFAEPSIFLNLFIGSHCSEGRVLEEQDSHLRD